MTLLKYFLAIVSSLLIQQSILAEAPPLKPSEKAQTTASGLAYEILKTSDNTAKPGPEDMVVVHYEGWLSTGRQFDSSRKRQKPVTFPLNRVIKGWSEGLQLMQVGETARLWIPAELAYGNSARPGAPTGDLVFDVELIAIKKPVPPPPTPDNLATPPKDAKVELSGLTSIVLKEGTGKINPKTTSVVEVHYSGWTADGNLFDSSVTRDEPLIAPLNRVIRGWTVGIPLMTVGEKRRFWVPANLAYGENPPNGAPRGQLVFDIELLSIKNL
jgi:peptidylprolyl isomerase